VGKGHPDVETAAEKIPGVAAETNIVRREVGEMSKENVRQFYEALSEDADLQRTFREKRESLSGKYGDSPLGDDHQEELFLKEVLPIAREAGYDFSFQDLKEYAVESKKTGELMDEELAAVAGGGDLCVCVLGGYGTFGDVTIGCALYGGAESSTFFCFCFMGGGGKPK